MNHRQQRPELEEIATRLSAERPVPRAGFRGELRRHLINGDAGGSPRPQRLRLLIGAYAGSGALLFAIVAAGVAGFGPLAA